MSEKNPWQEPEHEIEPFGNHDLSIAEVAAMALTGKRELVIPERIWTVW